MPRTSLFTTPQKAVEERREVEVRSGSNPDVIYTLVKDPGGLWRHVDGLCKGFSYRQHCRHVEEQEAKDQHANATSDT